MADSSDETVLGRLAITIHQRRSAAPGSSYTRDLLDSGIERCARKFAEEAIETVIAATSQSDERLVNEAADVLYHLLIVLEARNLALADVEAVLLGRMAQSGHAEKAARSGKAAP